MNFVGHIEKISTLFNGIRLPIKWIVILLFLSFGVEGRAEQKDIQFKIYYELQVAGANCDAERAKKAILSGANVNYLSEGEFITALENAVFKGCYSVAKLLLDNGAIVNDANKSAKAIFMALYSRSPETPRIIRLLLEAGADPNEVHRGYQPIDIAVKLDKWGNSTPNVVVEVVRVHHEYGADLDVDNRGVNFLSRAISRNDKSLVEFLLSKGVDPSELYDPDQNRLKKIMSK